MFKPHKDFKVKCRLHLTRLHIRDEIYSVGMSSQEWVDLAECGWDLAEILERLTANAIVATVLGSISASSDTVESEDGRSDEIVLNKVL